MKKILTLLSGFAIVLVGVWLGLNHWPYSMEPALWSEEALDADEVPQERDWHLLSEEHSRLLEKDWAEAFKHDLSWTYSARSLISHMGAMKSLSEDVDLLTKLRDQMSPERWEEIQVLLSQIDFSKINLERAIIFEYLFDLNSLTLARSELKIRWWMHYSPALTRRDLNAYYRRLSSLSEEPSSIPEDIDEQLRQEFSFMERKGSWWVVNPMGKILLQLVTANSYGRHIRKFYERKADLQDQIKNAL